MNSNWKTNKLQYLALKKISIINHLVLVGSKAFIIITKYSNFALLKRVHNLINKKKRSWHIHTLTKFVIKHIMFKEQTHLLLFENISGSYRSVDARKVFTLAFATFIFSKARFEKNDNLIKESCYCKWKYSPQYLLLSALMSRGFCCLNKL